jgi:MFS family permease
MTSAPRHGWLAPETWGAGLLGLAAMILFIVIERHHADPLVPPAIMAKTAVLAPNGAIGLQSMVGVAWLYLLTYYFQDLRGMNPLISGLWFAPMTVASVAGAIIAGRATVRLGTRRAAVIGLIVMACGLVVLTLAVGSWNSFALIIVGPVVGEIGFMLGSVALTIMATSSLGDQHAGLAAGLVNTSNQLGGGFGLGIVAAVVGATASQAGIDATALTFGFLTCLAFVIAAFLVVAIASGDQPERLERVPASMSREGTHRDGLVDHSLRAHRSVTSPHPLVAKWEFWARDLLGPLQHVPALRHTLAKAQDSTSEDRGIDDKCHHLRSRQYGNGDR